MAALQITVGGSAQNVAALYDIENEILDATTFQPNRFLLNNKYTSLIITDPVITSTNTGAAADPESWE